MPFPFGTGIRIGKNWVEKGSGIRNSPEFHGIPLGKHNQEINPLIIYLSIYDHKYPIKEFNKIIVKCCPPKAMSPLRRGYPGIRYDLVSDATY